MYYQSSEYSVSQVCFLTVRTFHVDSMCKDTQMCAVMCLHLYTHSSGGELNRPDLLLPMQLGNIEGRLRKFAAQC